MPRSARLAHAGDNRPTGELLETWPRGEAGREQTNDRGATMKKLLSVLCLSGALLAPAGQGKAEANEMPSNVIPELLAWHCHGCYRCRGDAEDAACYLRKCGYCTKIVYCHGYYYVYYWC
jgi:hypothetical protein